MATPPMATGVVNSLQIINNLTIVNGVPLLAFTTIFFIWFIVYNRSKEPREGIAAGGFMMVLVAISFRFLGLISDIHAMFFVGLFVLGLIPLVNRS